MKKILNCYGRNDGDHLELWMGEEATPADIALIAAAPDLYKALDDLLNDVNDSREVRQRGLRALKLARGEAVPSLDEDDADLAAAKSALADFDVNGGTPLEDLAKEIEG